MRNSFVNTTQSPRNLKTGVSAPWTARFGGRAFTIHLGTNLITVSRDRAAAAVSAIMIDGKSLLSFRLENGQVLVNLSILDENNYLVLWIDDNELVYTNGTWDIEFVGRNIIVRSGPRKILVEIEFNPPDAVKPCRGRIMWNGAQVLVGRKFLN
jgi:trigger factor